MPFWKRMLIFMLSFAGCMALFSMFMGQGQNSTNTQALQALIKLPKAQEPVFVAFTEKEFVWVVAPIFDAIEQDEVLWGDVKDATDEDVTSAKPQALLARAKYLLKHSPTAEGIAQARELLEKAATNDVMAQTYLGISYLKGEVLPKDLEKAATYLHKASQQSPEIKLYLGLKYVTGTDFNKNLHVGASLIDQAANIGLADAQFIKGMLVAFSGEFAHQDVKAVEYFKRAAIQHLDVAQYYLGMMTYLGRGVSINVDDSAQWVALAAEQSLPEAEYTMGMMALHGIGLKQDRQWAIMWFDRAAAHGIVEACYKMGLTYLEGRDVDRDLKAAAKYFYLAAMQNHVDSQLRLGIMYGYGFGVRRDSDRAAFWLKAANKSDSPEAQKWLNQLQSPQREESKTIFNRLFSTR